jgi:hypothetical protein
MIPIPNKKDDSLTFGLPQNVCMFKRMVLFASVFFAWTAMLIIWVAVYTREMCSWSAALGTSWQAAYIFVIVVVG